MRPDPTNARPSPAARLSMRFAAALVAVGLLNGAVIVSCTGDPSGSGGGGGSSGPASAAMSQWSPDTAAGDTCTQAQHDEEFVRAADGKRYPAWHGASILDSKNVDCVTGHEHGDDPSQSVLWDIVRDHFAHDANNSGTIDADERAAASVPFGWVDEHLRAFNNTQRPQSHVSYKVFVANGVQRFRVVGNVRQDAGVICDALVVFNQDTHSNDAFGNALHAVTYAIDCQPEAGATYSARLIISALARFGDDNVTGGDRIVPEVTDARTSIWVPTGQTSDYETGLTDRWRTTVSVTRSDNTELASFALELHALTPSRLRDATQTNELGRSVDLCYQGFNSAGQVVNDPLAAGTIVRRARGGYCQTMAPNGPATSLNSRIAWDRRGDSTGTLANQFKGCTRQVALGHATVRNAGGPTTWYTDPFGGNARTTPASGFIKQFISAVDNSGVGFTLDLETLDASNAACLLVHAPN
jgi:hypothetical protein